MKQLLFAILIISCQGIVAQETITVRKTEKIYQVVEQMPEFNGGDSTLYAFLSRNISYPDSLKMTTISGTVYAQFVVEKDGGISEFRIIRSPHILFSQEVERVFKLMPNWTPGEQLGKAVRVQMVLPIKFSLK